MAIFGNIPCNQDISIQEVRSGFVSVAITDTTKAVTFATAMPNTNYSVTLQVEGAGTLTIWPSAKTVNGFTLNLSLGISGTIGCIAITYG